MLYVYQFFLFNTTVGYCEYLHFADEQSDTQGLDALLGSRSS